jgi:predicted transcriptional regulator
MLNRNVMIGVRLTREELAKLDALAAKTERDRSKVVRLLLAQALALELPDIALRETASKEARHV